jgi:anthranilate/para-aminobenzoate synthase component I
MPQQEPNSPLFTVDLVREATQLRDPFDSFIALRSAYGPSGCFLLESLAGPIADRGRAVVGFGALLQVTVRGSLVTLSGQSAVTEPLRERLLQLRIVASKNNELHLIADPDFWALQRAIRDAFAIGDLREDAYSFGFFAVYGYDSVRRIESLPHLIPDDQPRPELVLLITRGSVSYDLHQAQAEIITAHCPAWDSISGAEVSQLLADAGSPEMGALSVPAPDKVHDSITVADYCAGVEQALAHIVEGDIYQVQLGHEISITSAAEDLVVYQRLRQRNPSPYMSFVDFGESTLISASPELFLRITGANMVMRPIAGTAPRTGDPQIDDPRVAQLCADEKELAEHLMLIDLCRNDLGRVAEIGSVEVDEYMVVENFSHVFHLVSNVIARKDPSFDEYDVIQATFPAGTMTGAPKVRAMEIIEKLETTRRGGYAGAFGLLDFGGFVNTGLTIRSIFSAAGVFHLRASGGVVADSTPQGEWRETLAKLSATYWAVTDRELLAQGDAS